MLTFGVEIELTNFWNGKPLITQLPTTISHMENEELGGDAILTFKLTPNGDGFNREMVDATIVDYQSSLASSVIPVRQIDVDSNGNIIPPWKEDFERRDRDLRTYLHMEDTVLHQAQSLLLENELYNWKVMEEDHLTGAGFDALELASPVLEMGDFNVIEKVCEIFSGITSSDTTCGLHIHIGRYNQGFEYEYVKEFVERWMETEPSVQNLPFYQKMGVRNHPLTSIADLNEIRRIDDLEELQHTINPYWSRNFLINLWALDAYQTIEFRGFKSTLNFEVIQEVVEFCQSRILELL